MGFITRNALVEVRRNLEVFPAVVILGSRQCGKSTMVKMLSFDMRDVVYLDLQSRDDLAKLSEPSLFFRCNADKLICLDEVQLTPELFSILRSEIDRDRRAGRFILLGSASRDLLQNTTETLAGRVGLVDLTPFLFEEVAHLPEFSIEKYWFRGGYPDSFNAVSDDTSKLWRENFIRTYVERDLPQLGVHIPSLQFVRLLTMIAHEQGQLLNCTKLSQSLGVTSPTIRSYIDIMEQTYIVRTLAPYFRNTKKRLVKSPKVYVRDSGLLHQLLRIPSFNSLMGNPVFGASWEGVVVENVCSVVKNVQFFFYRSATGEEMDIVLEYPDKLIAVECKASTAPTVTDGFWKAIKFLQPTHTYVVAPIEDNYPLAEGVTACGLDFLLTVL